MSNRVRGGRRTTRKTPPPKRLNHLFSHTFRALLFYFHFFPGCDASGGKTGPFFLSSSVQEFHRRNFSFFPTSIEIPPFLVFPNSLRFAPPQLIRPIKQGDFFAACFPPFLGGRRNSTLPHTSPIPPPPRTGLLGPLETRCNSFLLFSRFYFFLSSKDRVFLIERLNCISEFSQEFRLQFSKKNCKKKIQCCGPRYSNDK